MRDGWSQTTLGATFATVTGTTPPKNNPRLYGCDVPLVKPPELQNGAVDSANDGLSDAGSAVARIAPAGSVLVSCIGNLGKVGLSRVQVAFNQQINAILPNPGQAIPEFMFYQALSPAFGEQLAGVASGTTVRIVNKSKFNAIQIVLPPLRDQQRIVDILDEAFEGITTAKANAEKNLHNARALFESHLQSVFTQRDEGWVSTVLGEVCERVTVGHVGTTSPHYREQGIRFLRTQNVGASGLTLDDAKYITPEFHASLKKSEVKPGDVLMSRVITHTVRSALVPKDLGPANCANVVLVRPGNTLVSQFLVHYIRSPQAQRHLLDRKVGSAQLVVNTTVVKNWPIPLPPPYEQQRIVEQLDALATETQRLESMFQSKLAALEELKTSLLHEAFAGELGTQVA